MDRSSWLRREGEGSSCFPPPPAPGQTRADRVGENVPQISHAHPQKTRPEKLEEQRPSREVRRDFKGGRRMIMVSQSQATMHPQNERQCAWDEQEIVEPKLEESGSSVGFNNPAIHGVKSATRNEKRIAPITIRVHSKARITRPNASPTANLINRAVIKFFRPFPGSKVFSSSSKFQFRQQRAAFSMFLFLVRFQAGVQDIAAAKIAHNPVRRFTFHHRQSSDVFF
jgi:hypothetical protein